MSFYTGFNIADLTALETFIDNAMVAEGFTPDYDVTDYKGYKVENVFTNGVGVEAYFHPIFLLRSTEVGITLARSTTTSSAVGLIPEINMPKLTGLTFPLNAFLVANETKVALSVYNNGTLTYGVLVAASVDYRFLNQTNISGNATHLENLRNNLQCVFKVGDENNGRILYGGDLVDQNVFNVQLTLTTPSRNPGPLLTEQNSSAPVGVVAASAPGENFMGLLSGVYICDNTAFFNLDRGIDTSGNVFRFFREQDTGKGVLVKEAT